MTKMISKKSQTPRIPKKGGGKRKKDIDCGDPNLKWKALQRENEKWVDEHVEEGLIEDQHLPETADPSPAVLLPLLRFQKEFLAWALNQDKSEVIGSISRSHCT